MTQIRWQRVTEWPLVVLALVFLVTYGWEVVADLPDGRTQVPEMVLTTVWIAFVVDYVGDVNPWKQPRSQRVAG